MRNAKTSITRSEHMQLVGLLAVARRYGELLEEIERAAVEITGESHDGGGGTLTGDAVYADHDAEYLLRALGIAVEKDGDASEERVSP